jgi:hypothetical protein
MKMPLLVVGGFLLFGMVTHGQKTKSAIEVPSSFVKAETYLDLPDSERQTYTTGLMDGFSLCSAQTMRRQRG